MFSLKRSSTSGSSTSTTEQVAKRDVVLPSEIMDISPTTPEKGMSGYYLTPLVGAYFAHVPGQVIGDALKSRNTMVADIIRRGEEDQYLTAWQNQDFSRLGIVGNVTMITPKTGSSVEIVGTQEDSEGNQLMAVIRRKQTQGSDIF